MKNEVYITREVKNLGHNNAAAFIKKAVDMTLSAEGIGEGCIISVSLTDGEGIREINKQFRGVDSVTDVLSFPMNELTPGEFNPDKCDRDPETGKIMLGDMMICIPKCAEQGEEFGHGFEREIMYLAVHSTLHLLGYDHIDEGEMKRQMRTREKAIMGDED